MQAANALKNKRLRDQKKKVPFTKPDLSKVTKYFKKTRRREGDKYMIKNLTKSYDL